MDLQQTQIFAIIILGAASILVGLLPSCFANQGRRQWPLFLSTILCFGGGVLLSTSLCHILPEVKNTIPENLRDYSELIFCGGFFILYALDELVHFFYGDTHEINQVQYTSSNHSHSHERRHSTSSKYNYGTTERVPLLYNNKQPPYNPSFYRAHSDSVLFHDEAPSQLCHVGHQEPCHAAPTANLGLLVALTVHALLEGLVVGLERKSGKVLLLLGAIASHKLVVGFCLGMELASNPLVSFLRQFIYIFLFSFGSMAGIAIGMFISNIPNSFKDVAMPILQSLAGGTLLYVTVCEIIPRERARWHQQHNKRKAGILQCISVGIGFALMTTLGKYLDNDN